MTRIESNLQAIREEIASACRAYARVPHSVRLIAVSKTFPVEAIQEAYACGQRDFAENYVQECESKVLALKEQCPDITWHFIGPLQSNKTREVAQHCDWVHSIDRLKIAQRLSEQRDAQLPPLQVCLQVNISGEASKSGVPAHEAAALAREVAKLPRLKLRGLMCIPEPAQNFEAQRKPFAALAALMQQLNREGGYAMDTLSMGMSADMRAAIAEGATQVRIGTAIFGNRFKSTHTV